MNIIIKNQILYLPVFSAGEKLRISLTSENPLTGRRIKLIIKNKRTDKTYGISAELNSDNEFSGGLNLMTTTVFSDFAFQKLNTRHQIIVEAIDIANQVAIAQGFGVMQNSTLLIGSDMSNIPSVILTTSDFANIDLTNLNSIEDICLALQQLESILHGESISNNE